jgi:hypothetical protein
MGANFVSSSCQFVTQTLTRENSCLSCLKKKLVIRVRSYDRRISHGRNIAVSPSQEVQPQGCYIAPEWKGGDLRRPIGRPLLAAKAHRSRRTGWLMVFIYGPKYELSLRDVRRLLIDAAFGLMRHISGDCRGESRTRPFKNPLKSSRNCWIQIIGRSLGSIFAALIHRYARIPASGHRIKKSFRRDKGSTPLV